MEKDNTCVSSSLFFERQIINAHPIRVASAKRTNLATFARPVAKTKHGDSRNLSEKVLHLERTLRECELVSPRQPGDWVFTDNMAPRRANTPKNKTSHQLPAALANWEPCLAHDAHLQTSRTRFTSSSFVGDIFPLKPVEVTKLPSMTRTEAIKVETSRKVRFQSIVASNVEPSQSHLNLTQSSTTSSGSLRRGTIRSNHKIKLQTLRAVLEENVREIQTNPIIFPANDATSRQTLDALEEVLSGLEVEPLRKEYLVRHPIEKMKIWEYAPL